MTNTDDILQERGGTHGPFSGNAKTAQELKAIMRATPNWENLSDVQKEGFEMIVHKIARALNGNPNHADHYADMAGYARLVEKDICKDK